MSRPRMVWVLCNGGTTPTFHKSENPRLRSDDIRDAMRFSTRRRCVALKLALGLEGAWARNIQPRAVLASVLP